MGGARPDAGARERRRAGGTVRVGDRAGVRDPHFELHQSEFCDGWFRETYPLGAQTVRMELPEGTKVRKVQALRAGTELKYKVSGQTLEFIVPGVRDYEIAAVTTA